MVTENLLLRGGLKDIWFTTKFYDYYPLTLTSLWIEWRAWGMNPQGYHVVNVLLHAITACLFWRVLRQLNIPGAWLAGLIFAIHPVNVESVAWIAERKNTLPMVFYGLTILWFLKNERLIRNATTGFMAQTSRWYWLSLVAFLLALLSKTSIVMLPFVLLGCIWWQNGRVAKSAFTRTLPFFALSLILGLVTVWVQYNRAISTDVVQTSGFAERLARAGWAVWFYAGKAILPLDLSFVYPRWEVNPGSLFSYLPGVGVFVCLGLFWKFHASWGKPLFLAFAYFVVTLFPVLGFFNIYFQKYSFVADHWQYTSIIGLIALVVGGAQGLRLRIQTAENETALKAASSILALGLVAGLSVLTWQQCLIYKNDETLFRDTIVKSPTSWIAYHNLAVELSLQSDFHGRNGNVSLARTKLEESQALFLKTLELKPDHVFCHNNLGRIFFQQGRVEEALKHYREAVRLEVDNPGILGAVQMLAWVYATSEKEERRNGAEAVRIAEHGVKNTDRLDSLMLDTLAAAYAEAGRFDEAMKTAEEAIAVAEKEGDFDFAREIDGRRRYYRTKRPYRDSSL